MLFHYKSAKYFLQLFNKNVLQFKKMSSKKTPNTLNAVQHLK